MGFDPKKKIIYGFPSIKRIHKFKVIIFNSVMVLGDYGWLPHQPYVYGDLRDTCKYKKKKKKREKGTDWETDIKPSNRTHIMLLI